MNLPFDEVPVAKVRQAFEALARLGAEGFQAIAPGLYARTTHDEIVQLVKLLSIKDGSYSLQWGVSLAWLPHVFEPKPRFHRTLKSARFDLFEWYFTLSLNPGENPDNLFVRRHRGEAEMNATLQRTWTLLGPRLHAFFERTRAPEQVLAVAQSQGADDNYFCHDPHPLLVLAFTAHRLGDRESAASAFTRYGQFADRYSNWVVAKPVLAAMLA